MKKETLKKLIKTVINEIQDPEVRKQRLARVSQQADVNIQKTLSGLQTKIDADKRQKKAEPILNKKPFKKPFEEAVNPDITQFAKDIEQKILDRRRKKGWSDMSYPEAVRQMIEFKLNKEGWTKSKTPSGGEGQSHEDFLTAMRHKRHLDDFESGR